MKRIILFFAAFAFWACATEPVEQGMAGAAIEVGFGEIESRAGFEQERYTDNFSFKIAQGTDAAFNYNLEMTYNAGSGLWAPINGTKMSWVAGSVPFMAWAVAPAIEIPDNGIFTVEVAEDQSTNEASIASDVLVAASESRTGNKVNLKLKHKMARLKIVLTGVEAASVTSLTVGGVRRGMAINLPLNVFESTGLYSEIVAHKEGAGVFEVILPPQQIGMLYVSIEGRNIPAWKEVVLAEGDYKELQVDASLAGELFIGTASQYTELSNKSEFPCVVLTDETFVDLAFQRNSHISRLFLPNVKSLGATFSLCNNLEWVGMPEVTALTGDYNFNNCVLLEAVDAPKLQTINSMAFIDCIALTKVSFPELTSLVEDWNFENCRSLREFHAPKLEMIGEASFKGCLSLVTMSLAIAPGTNLVLDSRAFEGFEQYSGACSLTLGSSVTGVTGSTYGGCTWSSITIN